MLSQWDSGDVHFGSLDKPLLSVLVCAYDNPGLLDGLNPCLFLWPSLTALDRLGRSMSPTLRIPDGGIRARRRRAGPVLAPG